MHFPPPDLRFGRVGTALAATGAKRPAGWVEVGTYQPGFSRAAGRCSRFRRSRSHSGRSLRGSAYLWWGGPFLKTVNRSAFAPILGDLGNISLQRGDGDAAHRSGQRGNVARAAAHGDGWVSST
jgi:hypothetical protein